MVLRVSPKTDKPEPAKVMVLSGLAAVLDMQSATTWVTNTLVSMQRPSIIRSSTGNAHPNLTTHNIGNGTCRAHHVVVGVGKSSASSSFKSDFDCSRFLTFLFSKGTRHRPYDTADYALRT